MLQRYKQFSRDVEVWVLQRWGRERLALLRILFGMSAMAGFVFTLVGIWFFWFFLTDGVWAAIVGGSVLLGLLFGAAVSSVMKDELKTLDKDFPQHDKADIETQNKLSDEEFEERFIKIQEELDKLVGKR